MRRWQHLQWKLDKQNVTISLSKGINDAAFLKYQYSTDPSDSSSWVDMSGAGKSTITISDDTDAVLYFRVISLGNSAGAATSGTAIKLDKTSPTGIIAKYDIHAFNTIMNTLTFGLFFKETVIVTLEATDPASGIKEFRYTLSDDSTGTTASSFQISPQFKGNFDIVATDKAGNDSASVAFENLIVDSIDPTIYEPTGNPTNWQSTEQAIAFTTSDDQGIASVTYKKDNGTESTLTGIDGSYSFTTAGNGTYTITVTDKAGNAATKAVVVTKIDRLIPVVSVLHTPSDLSKATEDGVVFLLLNTAANQSGVTYYVQKGDGDFIVLAENAYIVNTTDNSTYKFKAVSGANVESAASSGYTVNVTVPAFTDIDVHTGSYTPGSWTNESVTLTLRDGLDASTFGKYQYSTDNANWSDVTDSQITIGSNFNGNYYFRVVSKGGKTGSKTAGIAVKVDGTVPSGSIRINTDTWAVFLNNITFGLFFKETVNITVTGTDALSGIQKTEYYKSPTIRTLDQAKEIVSWTVYTDVIPETAVDADSFIYYAKLTDNAGNVQYISSDKTTFDTTVPIIAGIANGKTYYVDQTATMTDTNMNAITVNGNPFISGSKLAADKEETYIVIAADKAGNSVTYTVYTKTIASMDDSIQALTDSNVKSSDKAAIEAILATVNESIASADNGAGVDQTDALISMKEKINDFLAKIDDISNAISDVNTKTDGITADIVKSSDKADLDLAAGTLDDLLQNKADNLTDDEKAALELKKAEVDVLLDKIQEVTDAIADLTTKTTPINGSNVKNTDKPLLEDALAAINDLLENQSGNLTDDEFADLEDTKTAVEDELLVIKTIAETIADIYAKTLPILPGNVKSSDKPLLDSIFAALDDLLNNKAGNLIEEEKTALEIKKADIQEELAKVKAIEDAIADINSKIKDITLTNVTSSDKTNLDDALQIIKNLLDSQNANLDDTQKTALEKLKVETGNALTKIQQIADAIKTANNIAPGITKDNVTKEDATDLEEAKDAYEKILTDYAGNLTEDEKKQTEAKMQVALSVIGSLDEVKVVETQIKALPEAKDVTKEQASAIENANKAYESLSNYQQSLMDSDIVTKLETVVIALKAIMLEDDATGTRVEGVDGTIFDINTELSVTQISGALDEETLSLYNFGIQSVSDGQEILQLYDIKLMLNGVAVQPDGKIKITLKLTEAMKLYTDLKIVYIAEDGTVTIIPSEHNDTEVWFVTDHFSNYGIIGTPPNSIRAIDAILTALIAITSIVILTTGILLFIKRRKRKEELEETEGAVL